MLKLLSAAALTTALLAAPAMAAGPGHARPHAARDARAELTHRPMLRHHHHLRPHFRFHQKLGAFHKHSALRAAVHRHG